MNYKLRLKVNNLEIEIEGTEEFVQSEKRFFIDNFLQVNNNNEIPNVLNESQKNTFDATPKSGKNINLDPDRDNLITFANKFGITNDYDFVLIAAYYNEIKNNNAVFDIKGITKLYDDARRKKYSNYSVLFTKLIKAGMIMNAKDNETGSSKKFQLTGDGIEYIENYQFNTDPSTAQRKK